MTDGRSCAYRWVLGAAIAFVLSIAGAGPAAANGPSASAAARDGRLFGITAVKAPSAWNFQRMGRLGVSSVRLQLHWGRIEDPLGVGLRDWSQFDVIVADAARAGVRVLPLLHGVPPYIAKQTSTPPVRNPSERTRWARFVTDSVRRYGPGGDFWDEHPQLPQLPFTAWQVWNEPNLPSSFGGRVDVRQYRDLLRLTANTIRAVDPGATIVMAGIFRFPIGAGGVSMKVFLKRFYALHGVKRWFDAAALHPYAKRPKGIITTIRTGRRIMRSAGDGRTRVWVTEFGWSTGGSGWARNAFRANLAQQAARLRRSYRLLARRRKLRVERAFWHNFEDFDHPNHPDPWQARMGLLTVKSKRKPSWYAYAKAAGGSP